MKTKILFITIILIILSTSVLASLSVPTGTYAYYNADETSGNLTDSLNKNNVTQSGTVPSKTGKISTARGTFSSANYFSKDITYPMVANSNFTISFWFNKTGNVIVNEFLIYSDNGGGNPSMAIRFLSNDVLNSYMDGGAGNVVTPSMNVFHHFVLRNWANNTFENWYDGILINSFTRGTNAGTMDTLQIGTAGTSGSVHFILDEIGLFNYSVSNDDITKIYNSGNGLTYPFPSSVAPIINNATYNLTSASAGQNSTAWRNGNEAVAIKTTDSTPTITFNTDINAYCRINKATKIGRAHV